MMNRKLVLLLTPKKSCLEVLELAEIFSLHQAPGDVHVFFFFQDKNPAIQICQCK